MSNQRNKVEAIVEAADRGTYAIVRRTDGVQMPRLMVARGEHDLRKGDRVQVLLQSPMSCVVAVVERGDRHHGT